jgi:hypothetical protein
MRKNVLGIEVGLAHLHILGQFHREIYACAQGAGERWEVFNTYLSAACCNADRQGRRRIHRRLRRSA